MVEQLLDKGDGTGSKVIITVLGKDKVGIIAAISAILAENGVNILDISQTILKDIFTMVMVCDIAHSAVDFGSLTEKMEAKGGELGLQIQVQREDVFKFMHRI